MHPVPSHPPPEGSHSSLLTPASHQAPDSCLPVGSSLASCTWRSAPPSLLPVSQLPLRGSKCHPRQEAVALGFVQSGWATETERSSWAFARVREGICERGWV